MAVMSSAAAAQGAVNGSSKRRSACLCVQAQHRAGGLARKCTGVVVVLAHHVQPHLPPRLLSCLWVPVPAAQPRVAAQLVSRCSRRMGSRVWAAARKTGQWAQLEDVAQAYLTPAPSPPEEPE
jgi:hypothetical protein